MVRARHPDVAALILRALEDPTGPPTLVSVQAVAHQLVGVEGFDPPPWEALANGQRPPRQEPEEFEPGGCRHGWQHEADSRVERQHRGRVMLRLPPHERAMLRSQSGPMAGVPLSTTPCNFFNRILLRRLRLPTPLSARECLCGRSSTLLATTAPHVQEQGSWEDGVALRLRVRGRAARFRKERTYPELVGPRRRARLVVLAGEVGGRWSEETRQFLSLLAKAKARPEPPILQKRMEQAWRMRWGSILSCGPAPTQPHSWSSHMEGADGDVPLVHDVISEFRHAGLA